MVIRACLGPCLDIHGGCIVGNGAVRRLVLLRFSASIPPVNRNVESALSHNSRKQFSSPENHVWRRNNLLMVTGFCTSMPHRPMEPDFSYFWPWAVNLGLREFSRGASWLSEGPQSSWDRLGLLKSKLEDRGSRIVNRESFSIHIKNVAFKEPTAQTFMAIHDPINIR